MYSIFKFHLFVVYGVGCICLHIINTQYYIFFLCEMKSCTRREGEAQAKLVSNYIFSNQIGCRYGNVMIIQIL